MFKQNKTDKELKEGYEHLRKGELLKAKESYLNVLALEPDNLTAMNNLSQIYAMLQDKPKSMGYSEMLLEECLKREPIEPVLVLESNALITLERKDEANEVFDEILKINPENTQILHQKSNYLELTGKIEDSLKFIERVLELDGHDLSAVIAKGRLLSKLKRYDEADEIFRIVFEADPKNRAAMNLKAKMIKEKNGTTISAHDFMIKGADAWKRQEFTSALAYFDKALDLDDSHDEIWYLRGELLIRMGRIGDAISSFEKAFELNPTSGGIVKKKELFRFLNVLKRFNTILGFEEN